jgi:TolB protein
MATLRPLPHVVPPALALLCLATLPVRAQAPATPDEQDLFSITVDTKGFDPYRIAVTEPIANDLPLAQHVREVAVNDLRIATAFKVLKDTTYPAGWRSAGMAQDPARWRAIGAQGLMASQLTVRGGQVAYEFALWDFAKGKEPVLRRTFNAARTTARSVVHQWCNLVMKHYTGVEGAFGTSIAFVATLSPTRKDVFIADHDGFGLRRVSAEKSLNILPAWSPNGLHLVYTSYQRGNPDLYLTPSAGGNQPRRVSRRPGLNSGAVYSPDGTKVAISLTKDGNSEVYLLDPLKRQGEGWPILARLTNHPGVDVSPTWSPDGSKIAFVSDRFGYPQIWVMNANGTGLRRVTRRGYYNTTPAWCPMKGSNLLAFTSRKDGRFSIFTYNLETDAYRRITFSHQGDAEEPTWAPNCQLIAYASTRGGIWVSNRDGTAQTPIYKGKALQPRWGPWATQH